MKKVWESKADRGWEHEMRDVVDSMILGRPPRDYDETLQSATLVLEAMCSYRNNGEVRYITTERLQHPNSEGK